VFSDMLFQVDINNKEGLEQGLEKGMEVGAKNRAVVIDTGSNILKILFFQCFQRFVLPELFNNQFQVNRPSDRISA